MRKNKWFFSVFTVISVVNIFWASPVKLGGDIRNSVVLNKFSWPYRLLVVVLALAVYGFMRQPAILIDDLKQTLTNKDESQWQALTQLAQIQPYSKTMMQGMLKMKYTVDWDSGNRGDAVSSYYAGISQLDELSRKLATTEGFRHFLCGDLTGFPSQVEQSAEGCWQLEGLVQWMSPVQVRVYFTNPETGWKSWLVLKRDGLFSWKVAGVELPVEEIFKKYQKRLML